MKLVIQTMRNLIQKTCDIYTNTFNLTILFSVFILIALILLPLLASYVSVGSGFIRFSSLYLDITAAQGLAFLVITAASLICLSFFLAAIISIVKLQETLDHVKFNRLSATFPKYILRIFGFLGIVTIFTAILGIIFNIIGIPNIALNVIIFFIWLPLIFVPQILVLEDLKLGKAITDSIQFVKRSPASLLMYIVLGFIMLLILTLIEAGLGTVFIWEHRLVSMVLVSLFVLPFLAMYGTELYIRRYAVAHT